MATGSEKTTFSVKLDDQVSASAKTAADAMESLRQRVAAGDQRLKDMSSSLRRLRGSSDEVKSAKTSLQKQIEAEKDSLSRATLAINKMGSSYDELSRHAKKAANAKKELKQDGLTAFVSNLNEKIKGLSGGELGATDASKLLALGMGALVGAIIAVTVAIGAATVSLGKWIFESANAARTANLFREAASGSASNAHNLGTQVDALARKLPTAKKELNDLAISLAKGGVQGQTLVDAFNAIGQANAALGDDAGAKLREIIDRGRLTQAFHVNPLELQGTGIQFDDIAKSLAKNMKVGVKDARQALFEGRVRLGDGAKALRDTVEQKFGDINLRRMMDLDVLSMKFKETLSGLTKDVNIEPFLKGLQKMVELFGEGSFTGVALKQLITLIGNGLVKAIEFSAPFITQFLKGMMIGALDVAIAVLKLRNYFKDTFGDSTLLSGIDGLNVALQAGKIVVTGFAIGIGMLVATVALGVQGVVLFGKALAAVVMLPWSINEALTSLKATIDKIDWLETGQQIIKGIVVGITSGIAMLEKTVGGLADKIKKGFKNALGISSPSKVFAEFGRNTTQGYAQGIEDGQREADVAISKMVAAPAKESAPAKSASTNARPVEANLHVHIHGADKNAQQIVHEVETQVRVGFTRLLDELLIERGAARVSPA